MRGLSVGYVVRRVGMFLFTIWASATLMFFIPRLAPGDPVQAMITRITSQAGYVEGSGRLVAAWRARFGLDDPLPVQYLHYLKSMATFDFGYSLAQFPAEVGTMIGRALPWTVGLLVIATALSFLAGSVIGALMAWRGTPSLLRVFLPVSLTFTAIPFYILGIVLIYVFVFTLRLFPISGGYRGDLTPGLSLAFVNSVVQHGTLPALSIVLASMGFWALGMRGMMVTVAGEDYLTLARAKGLRPLDILFRYEIRNAILPQVTALVLGIGGIVGGTVLVEYLFGYPGMGALLYQAISTTDYTVMQGIVFILILTTVTAVLIIDLVYPLLDPRISYERR
ncbi:peptide/nickel transport system permease protein [Actinopolymorpha cephalotaxi]|uniref:Peptide/nickel transport system permease protein n=1 Tax=Actinopolymorpha cephalotaxi TaxID=504797 RepID=A0A1I2XI09_9ACTN|nr:ABC transporter permease [Actinopolymorpha cephalotaxi]NYH86271.1 peptide/nickel transport system permease protein [Actinopolymorpha cephalotaxi]SFH13128.1 peptide/nickel transport system permease protein [Actinopolymorpha cephalotaxi]